LNTVERSNNHEIISLPAFLYQDKKVGLGLRDEIPFGKRFRALLICVSDLPCRFGSTGFDGFVDVSKGDYSLFAMEKQLNAYVKESITHLLKQKRCTNYFPNRRSLPG